MRVDVDWDEEDWKARRLDPCRHPPATSAMNEVEPCHKRSSDGAEEHGAVVDAEENPIPHTRSSGFPIWGGVCSSRRVLH